MHEYFVAVFDLYEIFNRNCEFCFRVKNSFDLKKSKISDIRDLKSYVLDPPDIIIFDIEKRQYLEFEIKRYRGACNIIDLKNFIREKILSKYSVKYNFLIIIQSMDPSLDYVVFERLNKWLNKEKCLQGTINFSFNNNNEKNIMLRVWPELIQSHRDFQSGAEQFNSLFNS